MIYNQGDYWESIEINNINPKKKLLAEWLAKMKSFERAVEFQSNQSQEKLKYIACLDKILNTFSINYPV